VISRECPLTLARAARIMREAMRDKSYQLFPLGIEAAAYLRAKRKRLTKGSYRKYEACLDKLARHFPDLEIKDFEPPVGTERLEEFMDATWGEAAPRTYNSNLSVVKDFFRWLVVRGDLRGDPTLAIERAKARDPHRETFTTDQFRAIVASQDDLRDRLVLRLLLTYGLRKGSVRAVQFKHFDHVRKTLTVFAKGGTVRTLPLPDRALWHDLERLILDAEAEPGHYLMPGRWSNGRATKLLPDRQISNHALHDWWYGCLARAGVVPEGTTKGERMHKARHTAGQRVLDATGNLKAVQKLLGHASMLTTADVYLDWDLDQLAATLADMLEGDE
jgi:integrase/recombinase XerC